MATDCVARRLTCKQQTTTFQLTTLFLTATASSDSIRPCQISCSHIVLLSTFSTSGPARLGRGSKTYHRTLVSCGTRATLSLLALIKHTHSHRVTSGHTLRHVALSQPLPHFMQSCGKARKSPCARESPCRRGDSSCCIARHQLQSRKIHQQIPLSPVATKFNLRRRHNVIACASNPQLRLN